MKPSVQNFQSDQPKKLSKREDKNNVNHRWNSRLYFQLGLIISLGITILVVESTIGLSVIKDVATGDDPFMDPPTMTYIVEKQDPVVIPKLKEVRQTPTERKRNIATQIEVARNLSTALETPLASNETPKANVAAPVRPTSSREKSTPENINTVEFVPVFPGCESLHSNEERKQCLSDKIRSFISRKFNTEEFSYLDSGTVFRIDLQFKIDQNGLVREVRSRAPERSLENEAVRVINLLPKIKPGMQGEIPVEVIYRVPITFKTE
jgi:protein TonB